MLKTDALPPTAGPAPTNEKPEAIGAAEMAPPTPEVASAGAAAPKEKPDASGAGDAVGAGAAARPPIRSPNPVDVGAVVG
jgi:hypothetical protein